MYRQRSGWSAITRLPAKLSLAAAIVAPDGYLILGGSERGRGALVPSMNQGRCDAPSGHSDSLSVLLLWTRTRGRVGKRSGWKAGLPRHLLYWWLRGP